MSDEKAPDPGSRDLQAKLQDKRGVVSQRLRSERQAEELRANLKRRKAKARMTPSGDK